MSTTDVYEWSVRIRMDRNALGGAFAVAVFALPPEEQAKQENVSSTIPARPSQWKDSPYYVGQVAALPTSLEPTGENQDPVMTQGFVSLDDALDVFLGSSDMQTVVQYMRSALVWKISSAAKVVGETLDEEVDLDKLPSLEVEVLSRKLENGLVQGPAVRHPEITQDKRGGATVA